MFLPPAGPRKEILRSRSNENFDFLKKVSSSALGAPSHTFIRVCTQTATRVEAAGGPQHLSLWQPKHGAAFNPEQSQTISSTAIKRVKLVY
jgi:hypothetical protein